MRDGRIPLRKAAVGLMAAALLTGFSSVPALASEGTSHGVRNDAKSAVPTLSKEVSLDGSDWGDRVDAPAGADLLYRVTATLPNYTESYDRYPYAFVDTHEPSIGIDADSIRIELLSGEDASDITKSFDIVSQGGVIRASVDDLKTTFPDLASDAKFRMSYRARLSGTPDLGIANPNENACHLEYMTDIMAEKKPGTYGSGKMDQTPDEVTFVYSYGVELRKVAEGDSRSLPGAAFEATDEEGRPFVDGGLGQPGSPAKALVTADDGKASLLGIGTGKVTLTETKAPDGYEVVPPVRISLSRGTTINGKAELNVQVDGAEIDELDSQGGILHITVKDPTLGGAASEIARRMSDLIQTGAGLPVAIVLVCGAGIAAFVAVARKRGKLGG